MNADDNFNCDERDYTLVFCRRAAIDGRKEILLGMKKRGFGTGKWNGFGGKIEAGETIEEGAYRELEEESCIKANELNRRGFLVFKLKDINKIMRVHVFDSDNFTGEPRETEEMRPKWFFEDEIPFNVMWPDDAFWMDYLLKGKTFIGRFEYEDEETISDYSVKEQ